MIPQPAMAGMAEAADSMALLLAGGFVLVVFGLSVTGIITGARPVAVTALFLTVLPLLLCAPEIPAAVPADAVRDPDEVYWEGEWLAFRAVCFVALGVALAGVVRAFFFPGSAWSGEFFRREE